MIPKPIIDHLTDRADMHITSQEILSGGCIHHATKIETAKGNFFLKWNTKDQKPNFQAEVKGLELIRQTETIAVPDFILLQETEVYSFLVLSYIDSAPKSQNFWEDFGSRLAQLHQYSSHQFGLEYDNYIGALPQPNSPKTSWQEFFSEVRIRPLLKYAYQKQLISSDIVHSIEKLLHNLDRFFPEEPAALIHGDLWGGNWLTDIEGKVVVFDPAVYFSHREMELSFMRLFNQIPDRFYESYIQAYPLALGWQQRMELYHLYPLLVHVILFGKSYVSGIRRIISTYL